jgi:hypothetical protein
VRRLTNQTEDPDVLFAQLRESENETVLYASFKYGGTDSGFFIREKARFYAAIAAADDGAITFFAATENDMFRQ